MRARRALLAVAIAAAPCAGAQSAPMWRSVDISRQIHDTLPQRIALQYSAGRVDVRGADDALLYSMHVRYDEARSVPLHRYDADLRSALLGVESRSGGMRGASSSGEAGELRLTLPRTVPLDLDFTFGGTESTLDFGGMSLKSVRLKCGAADATLLFSRPNLAHMRDLEVNVGAANFSASHLGNANADQIRVQGGVGNVELDFSGTWTRDLSVTTQLIVGRLSLRVPPDVGVRLDVQRTLAGFDHTGLVKRDDAWYSPNFDAAPHKLRIRAETFFGKIDIQRTAL